MKRILILCLAMIFVAGCWRSAYVHEEYFDNGRLKSRITLENAKAMVNAKSGAVDINLPDGASLRAVGVETTASPESATAIGDAIANVLTAGASETIKEIAK